MRTLVMGTGAVGAYFGGKLALAGSDVVFVARGANLDALRADGLRIEPGVGEGAESCPTKQGAVEAGGAPAGASEPVLRRTPVRAVADPAEAGPVDLILVCVKSYDTAAAAAALRQIVRPETIVLSLQNGIENEAILAASLGLPPLLGALTHIGAELVAPGVVRHDSGGRIIFGELDGRRSARAERLAQLFSAAGIAHHLSRHIVVMLWDKLSWNAAFNACTAVARRTVGDLLARPDGRALVRAAMLEVVAVANANGVRLAAARVDPEIERSAAELGPLRTSTLQDRDRGRRLEHDALNGAVVRAANRTGTPAAVNRVLYELLEVLDQRAHRQPAAPVP
jgi:2-dehydropantoate 2-reductase